MITHVLKGGNHLDQDKIIPYVEPIFRFCCNRLNNRCDAEDLSGEILCHVLDGMRKYEIENLDAWIWRIAHNRYAKFIEKQNKVRVVLSEEYADLNPVYIPVSNCRLCDR